jgi:neopullulanase
MKKYLFTILTCIFFLYSFSQNPERVEPMYWWAGMKSPELQLLVYGDKIALTDIKLNYPGVQLVSVSKVENPNYLFIDLKLSENVQPGKFEIQFIKNGNVTGTYLYELKARENNSANREGFNSSDVIYLIMPDRFANGNPTNDSHPDVFEKPDRNNPGGRHGGDIQGVINHLDYLEELGVTTLWSTPITEDNEQTYSYHGYACTDLYKIDPRYGTNEDYVNLCGELHRRKMKLILDFVPNHWGLHHWMIQDLPSKDWIHQWPNGKNGFVRSNYLQTTQFDTNTSKADASGCMDGWFDTTMPDLNESNPFVINYLVQNAIWWIEFADLDGLRIDTYPYNDKNGISEWARRVMNEYPNFSMVGEIFMHNPAHISFWQRNSPIGAIQGFNSHLPAVMDFPLYDNLAAAFNESDTAWNSGFVRIYDVLTNDFLYHDINKVVTLMGNHDVDRINQKFAGDVQKYKLALTLILTTRGIPQLYYGDEIGMQGNKSRDDGDIRRDFPGGWKGDSQNAFSQTGQTALQKEYFDYTKKLLNWRKTKEVIHTGKLMHFAPKDGIYVYFRYNDNEVVMIVLNKNKTEKKVDTKRFSEITNGYQKGNEIISSKEISNISEIIIPAKTAMVIELQK